MGQVQFLRRAPQQDTGLCVCVNRFNFGFHNIHVTKKRSGLTMSPGERSPAATSCSIGVKRMNFSRLTSVTRALRRASLVEIPSGANPANPPLDYDLRLFNRAVHQSSSESDCTN
jgi:hypothetical protein